VWLKVSVFESKFLFPAEWWFREFLLPSWQGVPLWKLPGTAVDAKQPGGLVHRTGSRAFSGKL
jgi:hypothetical protein